MLYQVLNHAALVTDIFQFTFYVDYGGDLQHGPQKAVVYWFTIVVFGVYFWLCSLIDSFFRFQRTLLLGVHCLF